MWSADRVSHFIPADFIFAIRYSQLVKWSFPLPCKWSLKNKSALYEDKFDFINEISKFAYVNKSQDLRFTVGNDNYKFDATVTSDKRIVEITLYNKVNNIPFLVIIINKNIKMAKDHANFFDVINYRFKDNLKWLFDKLNNTNNL